MCIFVDAFVSSILWAIQLQKMFVVKFSNLSTKRSGKPSRVESRAIDPVAGKLPGQSTSHVLCMSVSRPRRQGLPDQCTCIYPLSIQTIVHVSWMTSCIGAKFFFLCILLTDLKGPLSFSAFICELVSGIPRFKPAMRSANQLSLNDGFQFAVCLHSQTPLVIVFKIVLQDR